MTNLEIAQAATMRDIREIAPLAGLSEADYDPFGRYKAKLTYEGIDRLREREPGKLILVSAVTPTPAGEGKTTTSVGLAQGLNHIGRSAIAAIREPALGPVFGNKGGACGGGYSQVLPMEDINLFFTGDFPAITAAHNLLSAMLDAHLQHGNALDLDARQPMWPRTLDMGDRALRDIVVGLGGTANGYVREDGFVITPASEIMAILCLSRSMAELKERLGNIVVGNTRAKKPVFARELGATGAMAALLKDALRPNLVQTIEGGPALVHGGPFGNIAHGCSSILATECALGMAEFTITEAGFASDLGAEKFLNIVCPRLGRGPDVIVLVATVRALRHHGAGDLELGMANLGRHLAHLRRYGPPVVVAINARAEDAPEDHELIRTWCTVEGAEAVVANPWGGGGPGCADLARLVAEVSQQESTFTPLYSAEDSPEEKMRKIVIGAYGGRGVQLSENARKRLQWAAKYGLGDLSVCMAKTQMSLSDDPAKVNAPEDFDIHVREVRPSAGAGFLVAVAGEIMLMPGLGKEPAAMKIDIDAEGKITGMF